MASNHILGIDLGTTNSAFAILENGDPTIIPNTDGDRVTPSVVAETDNGDRLVGREAKNQRITNPEHTIESIKRKMGSDETVTMQGQEYTPEEISAMILERIKRDAEEYVGAPINRAVITVPAYFSDKQRQATKDAGKIAGFTVERIINEPTAAAMAYGIDETSAQTILVYDLGGGTFDVSVLYIEDHDDRIYAVEATDGDRELGGDDWDERIVDWILSDFEDKHGIDLRDDPKALQRVYDAAQEAKHSLSNRTVTNISIPFIANKDGDTINIDKELTREQFQELTNDLVEQTVEPTKEAIKEAGYSGIDDMDEIVLVGGSTRMAQVQDLFDNPQKTVNPDEAVAMGAAIQGGILAGEIDDTVLLDVTPLSLGVEVAEGIFRPIIERNTTIPVEESKTFTTSQDNQTSVDVRVFQGERKIAEHNEFLDEFTLAGIPPAPSGTPSIKVTFAIDENGIVSVSAKDETSGSSNEITIEGGYALDDEEIEAMRREAEIHAEEDRETARQLQLESDIEDILDQTEEMFDEYDDELPEGIKQTVQNKRQHAENVLKAENPSQEELQRAKQGLEEAIADAGRELHKHTELTS